MKRVTGLGGIFFKTKDPKATVKWYQDHLGITIDEYNCHVFEWGQPGKTDQVGHTVWSAFKDDTEYFRPGLKDFMINYRVENLVELLKVLEEEGVEIVGEMEEFEYGKFGWIMDPDGNKIELWEPNDPAFREMNKLDED